MPRNSTPVRSGHAKMIEGLQQMFSDDGTMVGARTTPVSDAQCVAKAEFSYTDIDLSKTFTNQARN